jgi:phage-related protein
MESAPHSKIPLIFYRARLCRPLGNGLWEIRTDLPTRRTARVLLCLCRRHLVALHGFIKKTRTTPGDDLTVARGRQKELER